MKCLFYFNELWGDVTGSFDTLLVKPDKCEGWLIELACFMKKQTNIKLMFEFVLHGFYYKIVIKLFLISHPEVQQQ